MHCSHKGMSMLVTKAQLEPQEADAHTPEAAQTPADAWRPLFPYLIMEGLGVLAL